MMDKLVIALSYYNAPLMLKEQIRHWQSYPEGLANTVKVILIDDGSMISPAEKELKNHPSNLTVELYRITKDIEQNIWGARNLAFHIASVEKVKWVLCLDIDHVLPSRGLDGFSDIRSDLSRECYYNPARYEKSNIGMSSIDSHRDSYLITPDMFWKVGGYDEDLNGYYYNGAAFKFRNGLSRVALKGNLSTKMYTLFYPSSVIEDASPLENIDKKSFKGVHDYQKKPSVLNFEWERVL